MSLKPMNPKLIGENIRTCRHFARLTQEELSYRVGITANHLGRIEQGSRTPSLEVLYLLSTELHVSLDRLVRSAIPPDPEKDTWPSQGELLWQRLFADCSDHELAFLVSLVQYVKMLLRR